LRLFVGPRFITGNSLVTVRPSSDETIAPLPDVGLPTHLSALGFRAMRDTVPNRFYQTSGTVLDFTADFYSQGLGSKYSYQSYRFNVSKYWTLASKHVLAANLFGCGTGGQPPFYGNCIFGTSNQLRGYTAGRYLDRYMAGMQVEYRLELPMRFGVVAFGGVGEVIPGANQLFRVNNLLPSAGGGIRFLLSRKHHLNLRIDAAKGKNGHTLSMGVGEAF
jgi:outer membrane protein assembly factor BamA